MITKTENGRLIFGEFIAIKKDNKILLKKYSYNNAIMQQQKLMKMGYVTQINTYTSEKEKNRKKFRYIIKIQQWPPQNKPLF